MEMESERNKNAMMFPKKDSPFLPIGYAEFLPVELADRFELYPENKRRPVNKTLFRNDYFQLTYNTKENSMQIASRGDIVYSAIPYDTARNYIQRAAIQYLLHPEEVRQYIELHRGNLEKYLMLSLYQVSGKKVASDAHEVRQAYNAIFENPLFEIQILGRLLQHDETGPLSANLPGKFLFSENMKTGITEYISEYLNFVVQLTKSLPITTDGRMIQLLEPAQTSTLFDERIANKLAYDSDIHSALALLPTQVKQNIEKSMLVANQTLVKKKKPLLRSDRGKELTELRKNYTAHSVPPKDLEKYFENVLSTENTNLINVISDIHTLKGELPFVNKHFNILAGDVLSADLVSQEIKGIYVIGNHELIEVLPGNPDKEAGQWQKWKPFLKETWFNKLLQNPDEAWYTLPIGDHLYYEVVKGEIEKRFPAVNVLNNSSLTHKGIRYIGLTIPVALVRRKKQQQRFILSKLSELLHENQDIPTIIVSHAPLFNELSMLSPKSKAYSEKYTCSELQIKKLFKQYNIIGVIHGHHHIPASAGRYKLVNFAGKELFVVCSIYSKMNTGFDLLELIDPNLLNDENHQTS